MGSSSSIDWTEATWNPTTGCTHVSAGCDHCYAEQMAKRLAGRAGYPADEPFRLTLHPDRLTLPLRWTRPRLIFVDSMSDLFHPDVPARFLCAVFGAMAAAPGHTFQVLTKRPERAVEFFASLERRAEAAHWLFEGDNLDWRRRHVLRAAFLQETGYGKVAGIPDPAPWPLPNVWLGTSVESRQAARLRIPHLLRCPAGVRFLSCEPLLGPVDLAEGGHGWLFVDELSRDGRRTGIHWVIAGGESGPGCRPCNEDWLRSLRDQCQAADVPFFLKQLGGHPYKRSHDQAVLDGRLWRQMPRTAQPAVAANG